MFSSFSPEYFIKRYEMNNRSRRWKLINGWLILMAVVLLCTVPASAITMTGTNYVGSIAPGGTAVFPMTIGLGTNENPSDLLIEVMGFGQSVNSEFVPLDPVNDTTPYSARTFISLDRTSLHLEPGTSQRVNATITLPKDVGAGGRYAIIYLHALPAKGTGQATLTTGMIVPVLITISGTTPTVTGSITGVDVGDVTIGQPVVITTTLKNTGDYHYRYSVNNVTLIDGNGNIVARGSAEPWPNSLIPGNSVQYNAEPGMKDLAAGTYTVDSKVLLAEGKVLDEKTTTFTVKTDYAPPVTESTITLSPERAGTLTSPDGRYSISFPQGAVLGDAVVILKPYSKNNLKPAPAGVKPAATSFEITGLSGLLSRDATVRVTYSADDLAAAGGNAALLKLSYYDAARGAWVILPTQVTTGSTTLTTTTNHLSVWAVMVSSVTTGGMETGTVPVADTPQGPVPPGIILASLGIAVFAAGTRSRKRK
jgi:hypothetical protein